MKRPPHSVIARTNPRQDAFDSALGMSPRERRNAKRAPAAAKATAGRTAAALDNWRSAYARRKPQWWHDHVVARVAV